MELTIQEIQKIETEILKEIHEICEKHNIKYYLAYGSVLGAIRHQGPIPWDTDSDIIVPIDQFNFFLRVLKEEISEKFYIDYYDHNTNYRGLFPRVGLKGFSTNILHVDIFKLIGAPSSEQKQNKFKFKLDVLTALQKIKRSNREFLKSYRRQRKCLIQLLQILLLPIPTKLIISRFENLCQKYSYEESLFTVNANGGYGLKEFVPKNIYGEGVLNRYDQISIVLPYKSVDYLKHFYNDYLEIPPEEERQIKDFYIIHRV